VLMSTPQGMNEVLGPIYYVFAQHPDPQWKGVCVLDPLPGSFVSTSCIRALEWGCVCVIGLGFL